jgi:hypothetical protein
MGCGISSPEHVVPPTKGHVLPDEYFVSYKPESAPFFRSRPEDPRPIIYPPSGLFSEASMPAETVLQNFFQAKTRFGAQPALKVERPMPRLEDDEAYPSLPEDEWMVWTWEEYWNESRRFAKSLLACSLTRYDGVILFGHNSPEWHISHMGITMAGGLTASVFPSDQPETVQFKMVHCRSQVCVLVVFGCYCRIPLLMRWLSICMYLLGIKVL